MKNLMRLSFKPEEKLASRYLTLVICFKMSKVRIGDYIVNKVGDRS